MLLLQIFTVFKNTAKNVKLELKNCKLIAIFKSGLDWLCYLAAKYKVVPTIFFTFIFPG